MDACIYTDLAYSKYIDAGLGNKKNKMIYWILSAINQVNIIFNISKSCTENAVRMFKGWQHADEKDHLEII